MMTLRWWKGDGRSREKPWVRGSRPRGGRRESAIAIWTRSSSAADPAAADSRRSARTEDDDERASRAIFRAAARPVSVAGKVGRPLSGLDGISPRGWASASFQIPVEEIQSLPPRVAGHLTRTPVTSTAWRFDTTVPQAAHLGTRQTRTCNRPAGLRTDPRGAQRIEFGSGRASGRAVHPRRHNVRRGCRHRGGEAAASTTKRSEQRFAHFRGCRNDSSSYARCGCPVSRLEGDEPRSGCARAPGLPARPALILGGRSRELVRALGEAQETRLAKHTSSVSGGRDRRGLAMRSALYAFGRPATR